MCHTTLRMRNTVIKGLVLTRFPYSIIPAWEQPWLPSFPGHPEMWKRFWEWGYIHMGSSVHTLSTLKENNKVVQLSLQLASYSGLPWFQFIHTGKNRRRKGPGNKATPTTPWKLYTCYTKPLAPLEPVKLPHCFGQGRSSDLSLLASTFSSTSSRHPRSASQVTGRACIVAPSSHRCKMDWHALSTWKKQFILVVSITGPSNFKASAKVSHLGETCSIILNTVPFRPTNLWSSNSFGRSPTEGWGERQREHYQSYDRPRGWISKCSVSHNTLKLMLEAPLHLPLDLLMMFTQAQG